MKKSNLLKLMASIIAMLIYINSYSQPDEIMDETVIDENERLNDKGPNMKKFNHFYVSYAPIFNIENEVGSEVMPLSSYYYQLGVRKKRKLCEYYAVGFDVSYSRASYRIDQLNSKTVPDIVTYDKERILVNNIGLELYNRFNFSKKRGNNMGFYIDIGAYGNWLFSAKHVGKNISFNTQSKSSVQKITNSKLDYIEAINYGARARIGFRKYILFGEYSLSGIFNDKYPNMPELPGIVAGIQLGLY